jgi:predicted nucleic acid-binding protein
VGGAIYDALVAATAQEAGARLVSRDRRAARTYEAIGARYELID